MGLAGGDQVWPHGRPCCCQPPPTGAGFFSREATSQLLVSTKPHPGTDRRGCIKLALEPSTKNVHWYPSSADLAHVANEKGERGSCSESGCWPKLTAGSAKQRMSMPRVVGQHDWTLQSCSLVHHATLLPCTGGPVYGRSSSPVLLARACRDEDLALSLMVGGTELPPLMVRRTAHYDALQSSILIPRGRRTLSGFVAGWLMVDA